MQGGPYETYTFWFPKQSNRDTISVMEPNGTRSSTEKTNTESSPAVTAPLAAIEPPKRVLNYLTNDAAVAHTRPIGDSYTDEARRYGLKIGAVAFAICLVVVLIVAVLTCDRF